MHAMHMTWRAVARAWHMAPTGDKVGRRRGKETQRPVGPASDCACGGATQGSAGPAHGDQLASTTREVEKLTLDPFLASVRVEDG